MLELKEQYHVILERGRRTLRSIIALASTPSHLDVSDAHNFNMFSLPRIPLPSFLRFVGDNQLKVDLPLVEIHDIETAADKRPRTLKHLLKANHANYSIIYHSLRFHNHTPHVCRSDVLPAVAAKL
jgi:hypothetical protein